MIQIKIAETSDELEQILNLQKINHVDSLTVEQKKQNGFVTVKHDIELLAKMNASAGQIIAKEGDTVVAYALVMLLEFKEMIPVLVPMFEMFNKLSYKQQRICDYSFYVMGQICISDSCRGQGIFNLLYAKHKEVYAKKFQICLTEVSVQNKRSMKAHENVGFKTIHTFKDDTDEWNILLWDWD